MGTVRAAGGHTGPPLRGGDGNDFAGEARGTVKAVPYGVRAISGAPYKKRGRGTGATGGTVKTVPYGMRAISGAPYKKTRARNGRGTGATGGTVKTVPFI